MPEVAVWGRTRGDIFPESIAAETARLKHTPTIHLFDAFAALHYRHLFRALRDEGTAGFLYDLMHEKNYVSDLKEGDKAPSHGSVVLLRNGPRLTKHLVEGGHTLEEDIFGIGPVTDLENLLDLLEEVQRGVVIYQTRESEDEQEQLFRVGQVSYDIKDAKLLGLFPPYFLSFQGGVTLDTERQVLEATDPMLRMAAAIPTQVKGIESYILHEGIFGDPNLGLGRVLHFGERGLIEEFFFLFDPPGFSLPEGTYPDQKFRVVGIKRVYSRSNGRPTAGTAYMVLPLNETKPDGVKVRGRDMAGHPNCFMYKMVNLGH